MISNTHSLTSGLDIGHVKGIFPKILKGIGWFFLLYIISVACVHATTLPVQAYTFYSENGGKSLGVGTESMLNLMANNFFYLLLFVSGLVIFLCKKRSLNQIEKPVKLRKFPLFTAIFLTMPFSSFVFELIIGICRPINIFQYLRAFISERTFEAFMHMEITGFLQLYISRMEFYWSHPLTYGYMITIFCAYYVIKQIYLSLYQTNKQMHLLGL